MEVKQHKLMSCAMQKEKAPWLTDDLILSFSNEEINSEDNMIAMIGICVQENDMYCS